MSVNKPDTAFTPPPPVRWFEHGLMSAWSALASAIPCYAEYLGLGALLGSVLLGYGAKSQGAGALLVITSAAVLCMFLGLVRQPYVAGPRAASLSVLVVCLASLSQGFALNAAQQAQLLCVLLLSCSIAQWVSSLPPCLHVFRVLPVWLVPAFSYASALAMVAGSTHKYLLSCLYHHPIWAWSLLLTGTIVGIGWSVGMQKIADNKIYSKGWRRNASSMRGLGLLIGPAITWIGYEWSPLAIVTGGQCARLGTVSLDLGLLLERGQSLLSAQPLWGAMATAVLAGTLIGIICSIETVSALETLKKSQISTPTSVHPRAPNVQAMRLTAYGQGLAAAGALCCVSVSQSRSVTLHTLYRINSWNVFLHGAALAVIALGASIYIAHLPQLALAVVIQLVAVQMITKDAESLWRKAYNPQSVLKRHYWAAWGIWLVVAITAISHQSIAGFVIPAVIALGWKKWRMQQRKIKPASA